VAGEAGNPYPDLNVYAFNGETYTGYSGKTDAAGHVTFTLPLGNYRFRADYDTLTGTGGVEFWSGNENTCALPTCTADKVTLPGGHPNGVQAGLQEVCIDYTYDALNRLISAEYSNGTAFTYTYDAAGNVLTYAVTHYGITKTTTYTYDAANRLIIVTSQSSSTSYTYDGLGNRYQQTVNGQATTYTLDLNASLTQVLSDGTNTYLYGATRIAQQNGTDTEYYLGDALNSVRQLTNSTGDVTLTRVYDPYGSTILDVGFVDRSLNSVTNIVLGKLQK
jgi:YD repeat-containing protein